MGRSNRPALAVVVAVVSVLAGAGLARLGDRPPPASAPVASHVDGTLIDVHVAGWVNEPGVVSIAEGSIVADAIEAAGGLRVGADADAINLAARVLDGDQIIVPGPGTDIDPVAGDGLISLNRATSAELQELPGVGPVLAERIIAFRESGGTFDTVEDLLEVPGIGETRLASIRDLIRP